MRDQKRHRPWKSLGGHAHMPRRRLSSAHEISTCIFESGSTTITAYAISHDKIARRFSSSDKAHMRLCLCMCQGAVANIQAHKIREFHRSSSTAKFKIYDIFPRCSALLMDPKYHFLVYPTNPWIPWILCFSQSGAACASGRIHGLHRSF
jgi:hypothetical protein